MVTRFIGSYTVSAQFQQAVGQKQRNEDLVDYLTEVASQLENRIKGMLHSELTNGHVSLMENGLPPSEEYTQMKDSSYESLVGSLSSRLEGPSESEDERTLLNGTHSTEAEVNRLVQASRMAELEKEKKKGTGQREGGNRKYRT